MTKSSSGECIGADRTRQQKWIKSVESISTDDSRRYLHEGYGHTIFVIEVDIAWGWPWLDSCWLCASLLDVNIRPRSKCFRCSVDLLHTSRSHMPALNVIIGMIDMVGNETPAGEMR